MKKHTRSIAHAVLSGLQKSFAATGSTPSQLTFRPSALWFMKDGVSCLLDGDDVTNYHDLVDALLSELEVRRHVVSSRTVEGLVQAAIAAIAVGPTPETVATAVETLGKEIQAPAVPWEIWCGVTDLLPPRRLRRFG